MTITQLLCGVLAASALVLPPAVAAQANGTASTPGLPVEGLDEGCVSNPETLTYDVCVPYGQSQILRMVVALANEMDLP